MKLIIIALGNGGLVSALILLFFRKRIINYLSLQKRIKNIMKESSLKSELRERKKDWRERLISPWFSWLIKKSYAVVPILNREQLKTLRIELNKAGIQDDEERYYRKNIVLCILALCAAGVIGRLVGKSFFFWAFTGFYVAFVIQRFQLKKLQKVRERRILKELPDVLDLLSVSILSGLTFDKAVEAAVRSGENKMKGSCILGEFKGLLDELNLGINKIKALEHMKNRCMNQHISMMVIMIKQAERLGMPMSNVLKQLSVECRMERQRRIEEAVGKLPVKMMFPMAFFIFPVVFLVLLAPAAYSFFEVMGGV